jgi:hypothetical protein
VGLWQGTFLHRESRGNQDAASPGGPPLWAWAIGDIAIDTRDWKMAGGPWVLTTLPPCLVKSARNLQGKQGSGLGRLGVRVRFAMHLLSHPTMLILPSSSHLRLPISISIA